MQYFGNMERFLSFTALTTGLDTVLSHLQDSSSSDKCMLLYRPEFGRSSYKDDSGIGSFCSILATEKDIYLVHSAWDSLAGNTIQAHELDFAQEQAHRIFSWYYANWTYQNWDDFAVELGNDFRNSFPGKRIMGLRDRHSETLEKSLVYLKDHSSLHHFSNNHELKNLFIYFYNKENALPVRELQSTYYGLTFDVVSLDYSGMLA